ncbi:unnamed protein product [Rotaria magnacalcarata]|uniref:Peptidase S1 domain-containing protein n=1 Tax=Rotaria magnacalcarata TaxID=392030 RepID=A0A816WJD3_9BILA|nr:unnamed protein product [Rotaria magnacalcarata]CAF3726977.1 unnamed protein product [Rotaria magnacalcarata]
MKLLTVTYFLWFILCIQLVENHFFSWLKNEVKNKINPNKYKRAFDCGKSDIRPILPAKFDTPRVTGGLSANDHSFPWVVNVVNYKSLRSCGGAIIGSNTILTAAHCIVDEPKFLTVIAGASTLFGRLNLFNYYAVSHVILHPNYVSCCDYDVAIIKLKKKLKRSDMINSICLPNENDQALEDDTIALIAGWGGKYRTGELNAFSSFHLKQGLVYIKSNNYCKHIFASFDEEDEICATNTYDNVDSREGDSGGPLMVLNKTDDRWYLLGVTSHGVNAETIKPGVYSSILTKLDFIKKYL